MYVRTRNPRRWRSVALAALTLAFGAWAGAAELNEDFSHDPVTRGWKTFGNSELFRWNASAGNLEVTWDSGQANSYFYRPLGTVLARDDDFSLKLDLRLTELKVGVLAGQPFTFQLALGFIRLTSATRDDFSRGTGTQSPNLVEFNYFADSGFGATISPIIVSTNNQFIPSFTFPLEMSVGDQFTIQMSYEAKEQTLRTVMTRNQQTFGPIRDVKLPAHFTDFRADAVSINSYSSRGSGGSLLARGVIDNVHVVTPEPQNLGIIGRIVADRWQVEFRGRPGWRYSLERTTDFSGWSAEPNSSASTLDLGSAERPVILESPVTNDHVFFRVRADRP